MRYINIIKLKLWQLIFNNAKLSYSQSGEDMILDTIFCDVKKGFYVDIGANNPYIQSNTHFFYKKGWRGVNVDALPGSMNIFRKVRPNDINIEAAISNSNEILSYFMFSSSFYNTFDSSKVNEIKQNAQLIN